MSAPRFEHRRLVWVAALLLLAALLSAGCGGTTKAEYERKMRTIGREVDRAMDRLSGSDADRMRKAREELEQGIDDIEDIDPPDEVSGAHDDFVAGLEGMAELMEQYEGLDPEQPTDQQRAMDLLEGLQGKESPLSKIERAKRVYAKHDYEIFASVE